MSRLPTPAPCFVAIAIFATGCPAYDGAVVLLPDHGTTFRSAQTVALTAAVSEAGLRGLTPGVVVDRVEFRHQEPGTDLGDFAIHCTVSEPPYTCDWDIAPADNGTHRWVVSVITSAETIAGGDSAEMHVGILSTRTLGSPGPGTSLFSSSWETATGNSDEAISDGSRWDDPHECDYGAGRGCEVVQGDQCASGNCLCFINGPDAGAPSVRINDRFPFASASDVYQRFYVWVPTDEPQPWARMHWLQDPGDRTDGTQNVMFGTNGIGWVDLDGDGTDDAIGATFYIGEIGGDQTGGFDAAGSNMDCATRTALTEFPVRVELHTRLFDHADHRASVQHHVRIFDRHGRQVIDDEDFVCDDGLTLGAHYARGDTLKWDGDEIALHMGNNDVADNPVTTHALCVDEYAFGIDGWLGSCSSPGCF